MDWHWHWRLSRQFRLSLIIGLGLLLLLGVVPYFIPIAPMKKAFQQAITHSTQRSLQADGAYFVLLPRPALLFKNVTLSEPDSSANFLRAKTLKLEVDILPFFSIDPHVNIEGVTLDQAEFNIIRTEQAEYNFDNLFNAHSHSRLLRLSLNSINFKQSGANIVDLPSLHTLRIDHLDLGLNDLQDPKNGHLSLKGKLSFDAEQTWKGKIKGSAALHLDRTKRLFQIANLNITIAQKYTHSDTSGWNTSNVNIQGKLDYGWQPLRLSSGGLILKSRAQREDQVWQTLITIPKFTANNETLSIEQTMIDMSLAQGKTLITAKARIPHLFGSQKYLTLSTKDAHIDILLKKPSQTLALQFKSALNVEGNQQRISLPHFDLQGTYHHQSLPRGMLTFSQRGKTQIHLQQEALGLQSQGLLDKSPMSLNFTMQNFLKPAYAFSWHVDQLDLTPYLPVAIEEAKNLPDLEQIQDFAWLNELKAEGRIYIGKLNLQQTEMDHVEFGIKADENVLKVFPFSASLYGGTAQGEFYLNNQGKMPQIRLKQRFNQVRIYPIFKNLFDITPFNAQGYLAVDIAFAGNTQTQWQETLGGTIDLKLSQGTFKGLDILAPLRPSKRSLPLLEPRPSLVSLAQTSFNKLSATFFIQKGIVYNKDLNIHTGPLHLRGEGAYNIKEDMLDYTIQTHSGAKKALTPSFFPLHIQGKLQYPHYEITATFTQQETPRSLLSPLNSSSSR